MYSRRFRTSLSIVSSAVRTSATGVVRSTSATADFSAGTMLRGSTEVRRTKYIPERIHHDGEKLVSHTRISERSRGEKIRLMFNSEFPNSHPRGPASELRVSSRMELSIDELNIGHL